MRSASSLAAVLGALAAASGGCGTWSNEDVAFFEALPTAPALRVRVPASAAAAAGHALRGAPPGEERSASASCGALGPSKEWAFAKPTGDGINAGIDAVLGLVDLVKAYPPTERRADARVWGPFDDDKHPGVRIRVTIDRTRDAAGVPTYAYRFEAQPRGGAFESVLDGRFTGESARAGTGALTLRFDVLRALGMNAEPTDPTSPVSVAYDRAGDPRTLELDLPGGFGLTAFDYGYAGYASGSGRFDYAFQDAQGAQLEVRAGFDASGAGRGEVTWKAAPPLRLQAAYQQCWDAAGCVTAVDDPAGVSGLCPAAGGCRIAGPCASVP